MIYKRSLIVLLFLMSIGDAQNWTWISGSNQKSDSGNYGTKGTAASTNLPPSRESAVSWIDNDGVLWLFGGYDRGQNGDRNDLWKYEFDQASIFTTNNSELIGLISGEGRWGDFDNDGDFDLLASGNHGNTGKQTLNHIYKNTNGNFTSTEPTHTWQQYHGRSSVDWGDVDNDGDLDVVVMGNSAGYSAIYKNTDNGTGHGLSQKLITLENGSARFGD